MLEKLRIKFIVTFMTIVVLVLGVSFSVVCYLDYQQDKNDVYEVLANNVNDISIDYQYNSYRKGFPNFRRSIGSEGNADKMPVAVYMVRDGNKISATQMNSTAVVDENILTSAILSLTKNRHSNGHLSDEGLYYSTAEFSSNAFFVAFADGHYTDGWKSLAMRLTIVGILTALAFFILSIFLSKQILKPTEEAWEAQQRFIADASHELKTPLTVIMANNSIMADNPSSTIQEQQQWIDSTQFEAKRMQTLVNDMLSLAKSDISSGNDEPLERVNLSDLAEMNALQFEAVAFERGIAINTDIAHDIHVMGHENKLQKLVGTLLDNACKYASPGTEVTVKLASTGKNAKLEVKNMGNPIPAEDLPHIFERFYRSDKARTLDSSNSFGLGLAIAQSIARSCKGSISATSSADAGTVFTVTLPLA